MGFKHVLVPTDFSDAATHALRYAVEEAVLHQAKVTLLLEDGSRYPESGPGRTSTMSPGRRWSGHRATSIRSPEVASVAWLCCRNRR